MSKVINAFCLFITACSIGYAFYLNYNVPVAIDNSAKNQILAEAQIISKKIDKNGIEHTIVEETNNVLPYKMLETGEGYDAAFVDSLIHQTDIQKKEIVSLTRINQTIAGKNMQAVAVIDSLNKRSFEYTDNNLYLSYTPVTGDSTKAGIFNYRYNQNLNLVQYNRKKWLFGKDRFFIDISTNDANSTINGVRKLSVLKPSNDFGVKVTAKSVWLPQSGNIGVGGQIRLRYKSVTATGSNYYFPTSQKWIPVVGLEYDLLSY